MSERKAVVGRIESQQGFYVGDICYAMADKDYHKEWGKKHGYEDGVYEVRGYKFAVAGTGEDGDYEDREGHSYTVDAGNLGILPLELCETNDTAKLNQLGRYIQAKHAEFKAENGIFDIYFDTGKMVYIDTNGGDGWSEEDW